MDFILINEEQVPNILLKNTYQNSIDRDIADIILLKQQDSEEFKKIVVGQNVIIYNFDDRKLNKNKPFIALFRIIKFL